jgi:hypothetical protein
MDALFALRALVRWILSSFLSALHLSEIPPVAWLVKGLLPAASVVMVFGPSGGGKTFWALDLMLRIASGMPWHGRKTQPGLAVLLAGEGAAGIKNRVEAFLRYHKLSSGDLAFALLPRVIDLSDSEQVTAFIIAVKRLAHRSRKKLRVIGIDTLARAANGADENSNAAMSLIMEHCAEIARRTGAAIVLIHHSGHESTRARGASAIRAALDTEIAIFPADNSGGITVKITKQKDAEQLEGMSFRLVPVELDPDEDGDPQSSLVVELDTSRKTDGRTNGGRDETDLKIMLTAVANDPNGLCDADWRTASLGAGLTCGKDRWYRLRQVLIDRKKVGQQGVIFRAIRPQPDQGPDSSDSIAA